MHHDAYDTRPSQTKAFTQDELAEYQEQLIMHMKAVVPWKNRHLSKLTKNQRTAHGVTLEVYMARIPIYQTTVKFLRLVAKDLRPPTQDIIKFARDTEEALFLFDETIAEYLTELFKKALRLHAVSYMRTGHQVPPNLSELIQEETELALWFTNQYDVIRARFQPFLRLS